MDRELKIGEVYECEYPDRGNFIKCDVEYLGVEGTVFGGAKVLKVKCIGSEREILVSDYMIKNR